MEIMQAQSQVDPQSGKRYANSGSDQFTNAIQIAKDNFHMESGYTTEQVSAFLQKNRPKESEE